MRVREGEDVTKHIQVVNRSARPLDFELLDEGGVLGAHDVTVNPRRCWPETEASSEY